jgi:hypothetical protein
MTVRHANSGDIPVLRRLLGQMSGPEPSPEQMEDRLALVEHSPTDSLYVCEQDGAVVGALEFRIREKLAEREGCKGTWLVSGFGREEQAHQFYEELGYRLPVRQDSRVLMGQLPRTPNRRNSQNSSTRHLDE